MSEQIKENVKIPSRVFIVPYRNRLQHKFFFSKYMSFILEDEDDYEIYFSHQCDARTFNRGAIKNIGFLAIKEKYPEHYKNITFIFNDVDTIPFNKIFDYKTVEGTIKHYYGYKYALGGIVVIKGGDFEKTNGYPCYWGWGMEDNALQKRCENIGLKIDRSIFYEIGSPEMLQLFDGISRIISKKDPWRMQNDNGLDGLRTISNVVLKIDDKSDNPNDNIFKVDNERIFYINILTFLTYIGFEQDQYYNYDLREPKRKIIHPDKIKETRNTVPSTNNWSNIPYYPTTKERRENMANNLLAQGKQIPSDLLKQIEDDRIKELKLDVYRPDNDQIKNNTSVNFNNDTRSDKGYIYIHQREKQPAINEQISQNIPQEILIHLAQQQMTLAGRPVNKFSPQYANYIGERPRAQPSARIRLGGVF